MPGTFCPLNRFGLTDYSALQRIEASLVHRRQAQIEEEGLLGRFDPGHLRKIHWFLFRDLFPWAGELRVVGLAKVGSAPFAAPAHIAGSLSTVLAGLATEQLLRGCSAAIFAERAAFYLGEINAIHPFREGNGRAQREFVRQLAARAGHTISWAGFTQEQMVAASILSHTRGDHSELASIIRAAIVQAGDLGSETAVPGQDL